MGDFPSAKDCYERTVDYVTRPAHLHTVYLRLADIYLREQEVAMCGEHNWMLGVLIFNFLHSSPPLYPSLLPSLYPPPLHHTLLPSLVPSFSPSQYEKAKTTFLHACRTSPSSVTWRGVGIACYKVAHIHTKKHYHCNC